MSSSDSEERQARREREKRKRAAQKKKEKEVDMDIAHEDPHFEQIVHDSEQYHFDVDDLKSMYVHKRSPLRSVAKGVIGITIIGGLGLLIGTMIVPDGHVALRKTATGRYVLLPPGRYSNLPGEVFVGGPVSLSHQNIQLGPINIVTVKQGEVGISYSKGKLVVLPTGQHILHDASHTFERFVSLKRETMRLDEIIVNTGDNVSIRLHSDVVYQIEDALLAINGIDNIEQTILDTAAMTMSRVIGSHRLNDIMQVTGSLDKVSKKGREIELDDPGSSMTQLIYELEESLSAQLHAFGVRLLVIGIRDYDVMDKHLSNQLAQSAVLQANISAQYQTAENESRIIQVQAEAKKQSLIKQAEGEAESARVRAHGILEAAQILEQSGVAIQMTYNSQKIELVGNAHKTTLFYLPEGGSQPNINVLQS
jgi:regulator of protease activity HflC (stomatin/prohibitin superfamily)